MNWLLSLFGLPPVGPETALHIDLASAIIALFALIFSIWTWRHQTRLRRGSLLAQRDSGLIRWIETTIDTIVEIEFFLRRRTPTTDAAQYSIQRDDHLAKLAAAIDKGRLYFPKFTRDVIGAQNTPATQASQLEAKCGDGNLSCRFWTIWRKFMT